MAYKFVFEAALEKPLMLAQRMTIEHDKVQRERETDDIMGRRPFLSSASKSKRRDNVG